MSLSLRSSYCNCVSTYTSRPRVKRILKRKGDVETKHYSSPKRRRSSGDSLFSFLQQCLFCGKDCNVHKSRKNQGRWRKAFIFRQNESTQSGKNMKQFLQDICDDRKDKWAGEVRVRIQGAVSDLHAADAQYNLDCRTTFITERAVKAAATAASGGSSCSDEPFEQVVKTMESDKSRIRNSFEVFDIYDGLEGSLLQRKQLMDRLKEHFGEDLVILSAAGFANILIFRSKAPNVI